VNDEFINPMFLLFLLLCVKARSDYTTALTTNLEETHMREKLKTLSLSQLHSSIHTRDIDISTHTPQWKRGNEEMS
jgi:hypothetical protein